MRALSSILFASLLAIGANAVAGPDTGSGSGSGSGDPAAQPAPPAPPPADTSNVKPEDMPTGVRVRRLEQRVQALKERGWQLKARVQILKEQMVSGGVGAQAVITHGNDMSSVYRLISITYNLDGTQIFVRTDDSAENLYKTKSFDVFEGPISPGKHTLTAVANYRGHGYGPFEYMNKYTFTAKGAAEFTVDEGKITKVDCSGHEKGGQATAVEKRPAIDCKVAALMPDKPAAAPTQTTPGTTPVPPATPAPGK